MVFCAICGWEIPSGWPYVMTDEGLAHRFRTWCDTPEPCPEIKEVCEWLARHGKILHTDYTYNEAPALLLRLLDEAA